jgi:16S rRNA (guanine(966)-N(2))-methyltransferase RsmD
MRVIAGQYKGRNLKTPAWEGVRPTSDKLRETLFNILAPRIDSARFADVYSGTGAVGIEALSRGASHVTFIEKDRRATALIAANLAVCGIREGYTIECGDAATVLRRLPDADTFDLVLLDPPYDADPQMVAETLSAAASRTAAAGAIVLERASRREPLLPEGLERVRDVVAGDSALTFLRRSA